MLDRAQLLGIYFAMRGVRRPPAHLARCEEQLRRELEAGEAPPALPSRGHLQRVK
ncbi:MAG TPA: hypothetical protein VFK14_00110 [Solirubrobacterales bacterium]|nr:hypothetical protein [Solirubrobacterales bacterium]